MMIHHFFVAIVLTLLPVVSLQAQTESTSKPPLNSPEFAEAAKLATEVAALYKLGKYKEALPLAKRCLQIREKSFTPSDEELRTALNNLAEVYMALRKYDEAEPLFQRLIKSYEKFAPTDSRLVTALQRLALIRFGTGEHDKTENLYRRGLEITENTHGPNDPKVAAVAYYLAEYYHAVGNFEKAEPLYQRVFAIRETQTPSGDSEEFRQVRDRYACLLYKTGREERARDLERRPQPTGTSFTPAAGSVINGKAINLPKPRYPDEARAVRASGTVLVRVVIDERGKVIRACAIRGPSLLMRASEAAALNAVFSPTKLSGQPVKVSGMIDYNFIPR